jgi:Leucine-rich repeat (LRR) protein
MGGSKSKELKETTILNLSNKRLSRLEDILALEDLNPQQKPISQLTSLIDKLGSLFPKLYSLDLSNNLFKQVPTALQQLVTLTQLSFSMNRITFCLSGNYIIDQSSSIRLSRKLFVNITRRNR